MNGRLSEIPFTDTGRSGVVALFDAHPQRAAGLLDTALARHPLMPLAARAADPLSRRWLERQRNPYLDEIRHIAKRLHRPGAFFFNVIYEWACSTSHAPDPGGAGARLIRVLDWGFTGIGRYVVVGLHHTRHGPFYNATWPGFVGVLTAMAPGRFAAAINQAPRLSILGTRWLDEPISRRRILRSTDVVPAAHLLRQVFETAKDYGAALAMLADETVRLPVPALFTLSGIAPEDGCVIEAIGKERRVHRAAAADGFAIGVANDWLSADLAGEPRRHAVEWSATATPRENNRVRRAAICQLQGGPFAGAADLAPPVLNSHTVLVVSTNAATGAMTVEALDPVPGAGPIPRVIARRDLRHG